MNRLLLLAGIGVLGLAACGPEVRKTDAAEEAAPAALRTISKLDCPQAQGELQLVSAAPDGRSCAYKAAGAEVNLRLVALNGEPSAVLAPIEAELKGIVPPPVKAATPATPAAPAEGNEEGGKAEINFPGLQIKADDSGANIRIGNIRIDADEQGGAEVKVGGETTVNANDGGAEIRTGTTSGEVRSTYILASESAPNGYHVAGYEARGPKGGPIVVATVKAREEDRSQHDLFDDLKDLVERQVGE
ncbi:MAG TPA: hypothetical protein VD906_00615 [Caulobacteraceae bacterium]|nr:hypothetical protein [Caulobacteraceae bacterium]